jgi:hypothetical protein
MEGAMTEPAQHAAQSQDGAAEKRPKSNGHNGRGGEGPPALTLPYADFSHALVRAHHGAHAMVEANRHLAETLRDVMRRQQDLAFELAEAALGASGAVTSPAAIFDRAANAVREVGQAIIDAQIEALRRLQTETNTAPESVAAFAFPPVAAPETVKSTRPIKPGSRA